MEISSVIAKIFSFLFIVVLVLVIIFGVVVIVVHVVTVVDPRALPLNFGQNLVIII